MNRDEYLAKCKKRALEYLDRGELQNAVASMGSDLRKHPEFTNIVDQLLPLALLYVVESDVDGARRWIVGFR